MITIDNNKCFKSNLVAELINLKQESPQPDVTTYAFSSDDQLLSIVVISTDQKEKQRDTTIIPLHFYNVKRSLNDQWNEQ